MEMSWRVEAQITEFPVTISNCHSNYVNCKLVDDELD